MGGGKHERLNPHGSPGGQKLPGDQLAEDVHGRKGMYQPRRRKGRLETSLEKGAQVVTNGLTNDDFQIVFILFTHQKFCPSVMLWDEILGELKAIGRSVDSTEPDEFIKSVVARTDAWIAYVPSYSLCLRREHAFEIQEFVNKHLKANQEP
jgi:hypothetical protein